MQLVMVIVSIRAPVGYSVNFTLYVSIQLAVCKVQSDWQDLDPILLKAVLRFV